MSLRAGQWTRELMAQHSTISNNLPLAWESARNVTHCIRSVCASSAKHEGEGELTCNSMINSHVILTSGTMYCRVMPSMATSWGETMRCGSSLYCICAHTNGRLPFLILWPHLLEH